MHPIYTLRRPVAPLVARGVPTARTRIVGLLLWLIVLAPLAWGVHATWPDIARFLS